MRVKRPLSSRAWLPLLALALGITNAVVLAGWDAINPKNTAWVFGDTATYYVGWALYRHDPHLHFPLSWTDRVGYPVGASIALLDAIPLAAILLRPLSPILPEPFQYLGLYLVLCFVLQAYFGMRLCQRLFPSHPAFAAIGGVFFLLSPPLTLRATSHIALASHWTILAAFDGYLRDSDARPLRWLARLWIVLAIAAGLNPYIAFLCFLVAVAGAARLALEHRWRWLPSLLALAATAVVFAASLVPFGVVENPDAATYRAEGYGKLSMNLNAPVNPMRPRALFLPTRRMKYPEQYEGYNYLGAGVLALLVVGVARRPSAIRSLTDRRLVPLVGLAVACTALAVSATVTLGPSTLLVIPLPPAVFTASEALRASGRLFWPAYYLIVTAALALTVRGWKPRTATVMLAGALAIQIADLSPLRRWARQSLHQRWESRLQSPVWTGLGRQYDNLILVPPFQCGPERSAGGVYSYVWFGKLAAAERMRSNDYYAARYSPSQLYAHCVELLRSQLEGVLDRRSAYVVTDAVRTIWSLHGVRSHQCDRIDGFNLCTPGASAPPAPEPPAAPAYVLGQVLDLSTPGAESYLPFGWGAWMVTGTWTDGPLALVRLGLDTRTAGPLILEVDAEPFVGDGYGHLEVEVAVNGNAIDRWVFDAPLTPRRLRARIPAAGVAGRIGLDIELRVRYREPPLHARRPAAASFPGLKVRSLVLHGE
jgi:Family of unknown function (DUF6311)